MPSWVAEIPLWALAGAFVLSAAIVWLAGTWLVRFVDPLARKSGFSQAFAGMLLLGGITSLPEVSAVGTSAAIGNAPLAINNLIGTASINLVLLALADAYYGKDALTRAAARQSTLMQGVLSMLLAIVVAMLATLGDVAIFGVGAGAALLAAGALAALAITSSFQHRHVWEAVGQERRETPGRKGSRFDDWPLGRLSLAVALCAGAILVAGSALSVSADAIASATGIDAGLTGFLLIGLATSLPEASSIVSALRLRRYQMAVGDVFGTNMFNFLLIFLADLLYRGGPVLDSAGQFEGFGAMLAAMLTGLFVVGLLERRDRTVLRMGYDSLAVLLTFALGVWLLFRTTA